MKLQRRRRRFLSSIACATLVAMLAIPQVAHAWDPSVGTIAPGVVVGGVQVGDLAPDAALARIRTAYQQPAFAVTIAGSRYAQESVLLGQIVYAAPAVALAMNVGRNGAVPAPATPIPLKVTVRESTLKAWVKQVAAVAHRDPVDASIRLVGKRPRITREREGFTLDQAALVKRAMQQLTHPAGSLRATTNGLGLIRAVHPSVTAKQLPQVIVIDRSENRLWLYSPRRLVREFRVATGRPEYPTPVGHFSIATKQLNPWWYPPAAPWAAGEEPIPPGPGNPLGTRWMGLSEPGVGIHGTPNAASIGYSASHGCIRMRIPDAEKLFSLVDVGTIVDIVR